MRAPRRDRFRLSKRRGDFHYMTSGPPRQRPPPPGSDPAPPPTYNHAAIRQTRMQPFVRIRRHRFRSSFLYLRRGGISNLRRGARWLPPSQSCTHMHITSSCAKSRWYLSLPSHISCSAQPPTSTTSPPPSSPQPLPTCSSNPAPPHAFLASACISPPHASLAFACIAQLSAPHALP